MSTGVHSRVNRGGDGRRPLHISRWCCLPLSKRRPLRDHALAVAPNDDTAECSVITIHHPRLFKPVTVISNSGRQWPLSLCHCVIMYLLPTSVIFLSYATLISTVLIGPPRQNEKKRNSNVLLSPCTSSLAHIHG